MHANGLCGNTVTYVVFTGTKQIEKQVTKTNITQKQRQQV